MYLRRCDVLLNLVARVALDFDASHICRVGVVPDSIAQFQLRTLQFWNIIA